MLKRIILVNWTILISIILVILLGHGGLEPEVAIIPSLNSTALILRTTMPVWLVALSVVTLICGVSYIAKSTTSKNLSSPNFALWSVLTVGPFVILVWAITTGQGP